MRILFVTPYPPSRIRVRSLGFLTHLHRKHEVTVMTQWTSPQELADVEILRAQGYEVVAIREPKRDILVRSGLGLLSPIPLQVAYSRSRRFVQAVRALCTQRSFDVVHVEHLRGIASLEQFSLRYPMVWDAVDCISLLFQHTMTAGPTLPIRTVARVEHGRTRRYETRLLDQPLHIVVTSDRDRAALVELHRTNSGRLVLETGATTADRAIDVLPNGVDLDYFHPQDYQRRRFNVVFSGKMSYHANIATALYLYHQIMPLVWQQRPEATLTIVGSKPSKEIQRLTLDPRVEVTGYVEDMRVYVGRADVMVCPMVYSVGIQNKVLEAMALGTPVVVPPQVAAALHAQHGRDVLVAETPRDFAAATLKVLDDTELRAALGQNGLAYVREQHDWDVVSGRLTDIYQRAINTRVALMSEVRPHPVLARSAALS